MPCSTEPLLKLAGMAEAYQEHAESPDFAKLGFDDRLVMLLERERQQRNDRSYLARLRKAQLRERADIADIDCSAGRGITRTTLLNLATGGWIHAGANLTVVGATGWARRSLPAPSPTRPCRQNRSVAYLRVPDLVLSLDAGRGGTNYIRLMRRLTTVDLLILDDWGLQNFSPQGRRDILELIEPRSARRSTMIVSQLPVSAWHNVLGESTIADAILDRIVHYGHHITLTEKSRRKLLKPPPIDDPRPTH